MVRFWNLWILGWILKAGAKKGSLRFFFGFSAGVGKTYAMLKAAHREKARGVDVVAGYIEPHLRAETLALVLGLESVPLNLGWTLFILGLMVLISILFKIFRIEEFNILLVFLTGVFFIVIKAKNFLYGIFSSVLCVMYFNYFFTEPYHFFYLR